MGVRRVLWGVIVLLFVITVSNVGASKLHQEDGIFPNHSAEYVRTLNRFASTEPDAAYYNPAGLSFLDGEGAHLMVSAQSLHVEKTHAMDYYAIKVEGANDEPIQTFSSRSPFTADTDANVHLSNLPDDYTLEASSPVMPDVDVVYKKDKWAAYVDFSVMQAAPGVTLTDGAAIIDWGNLAIKETELASEYGADPSVVPELRGYYRDAWAKREEMFLGLTFGGAYRIGPSLSVGGGLRVIRATGRMTLDVTNVIYFKGDPDTGKPELIYGDQWHLDTEYEGMGYGWIASLDYKPSDILNLALKFEYYPPLELEKNTLRFLAPSVIEKSGQLDIFKDGSASSGDEMVYQSGNGTSTMKVTYPPSLSGGLSYKVNDRLTLDGSLELTFRDQVDLDGRENDFGLGYRCGGALRWEATPTVEASCGYLYTDYGIKDDKRTESDMLLTSHSLGAGAGIKISDRTELSLGAMVMVFQEAQTDRIEYTNSTGPVWHYIRKTFNEERYILSTGITYRF